MRAALPLIATALVLALAGCGGADIPTAADPPPASFAAADVDGQLPLSGELVSQGARTSGTVTLAATSDTEFTLTLSGFSTGAADDLRLQLSPGTLVQGADGYYSIDDNVRLELPGAVDPSAPEQSFVFPLVTLDGWEIHSFAVYDYANRTAFGSAALSGE